MSGIVDRVESEIRVDEPLEVAIEEGPLLAAALAAVLVEYRRYLGQGNGHSEADGNRTNWRLVSRLQQLRSLA